MSWPPSGRHVHIPTSKGRFTLNAKGTVFGIYKYVVIDRMTHAEVNTYVSSSKKAYGVVRRLNSIGRAFKEACA